MFNSYKHYGVICSDRLWRYECRKIKATWSPSTHWWKGMWISICFINCKTLYKISFCWDASCRNRIWFVTRHHILNRVPFSWECHFYRAAWNADAVLRWEFRPSVRPSVRQTRALWQNGRKICLDFYMIRKIIYPSFLRKRMVGGGRPYLPEILGQPACVGAKSPILNR